MRDSSVHGELDFPADHQLGQVVLVRLGRPPLADDAAASDHRDPVRDLEHLVQLVADEDDAVPLRGQAPQDGEDLLGLLWREDGGRLVEHEDARIPVEGLEDLDALLPADGERADLRFRVDLEPEPPAELHDPPVGLLAVEEDPVGHRLLAEEDVVGHAQDGDEHEMLVDHVDPARDRVGRAGDPDGGAVQQDLALVRPRQAIEDVHERRLARPILAEEGMDLARADLEVDPIVRDHARVALRDPAHLERRGEARAGLVRHGRGSETIVRKADGPAVLGRPVRNVSAGWSVTWRRRSRCRGRSSGCRPSSPRGRRRARPSLRGRTGWPCHGSRRRRCRRSRR